MSGMGNSAQKTNAEQPTTNNFSHFCPKSDSMKKLLFFGLLTLAFSLVISPDLHAQRKGKKKKSSKTDEYFDESGFVNKLWYGGNFTLGFAGGNNQSQFAFGLSPMVGYKVLGDIVSVGPRVGFEYNHIRVKDFTNTVYKASTLSYSAGIFARVKPITNVFAHFEYEYQNADSTDPDQDGFIEIDQNGDIITERVPFDNVYIGLGYHSGGGLWGYEILLLYNVNQAPTTVESPFDIRFGITYKF
jgi:hypothetical protein